MLPTKIPRQKNWGDQRDLYPSISIDYWCEYSSPTVQSSIKHRLGLLVCSVMLSSKGDLFQRLITYKNTNSIAKMFSESVRTSISELSLLKLDDVLIILSSICSITSYQRRLFSSDILWILGGAWVKTRVIFNRWAFLRQSPTLATIGRGFN